MFLLLLIVLSRGGQPTAAQTFAEAGIDAAEPVHAPLYSGERWKPAPDAAGYALVAANDKFRLFVRPDNLQIAVDEIGSGYRWTSNPIGEQLAKETVKGQLLSNLKSPFTLTYVKTGGTDQTVRGVLNGESPGTETVMTQSADGLQVVYSFPEQKLGFAIQYELTEGGLKVRVPANGIREEGDYSFFSLDILPYFGAAAANEDGYLFVPDGPGGLINFNVAHADISRGYIHQVYGTEVSNSSNWMRSGERREDIAYPVFGMKRGEHAYLAILTEGDDSANIAAMAPGAKSSFFNIYSSQIYREEYLYQMSRLAAPTKAIQKQRLDRDRELEYRFLSGKDAGYVGMADAYRDYLTEAGQLKSPLKPVDHVPLYLKIMGGNFEKAYGRVKYVAATTFPQATDIVERLRGQGVANAKVIYYGWQNQGDYDMEKRFPIESALGGESAAKKFVAKMKEEGTDVLFQDDFLWVDEHSATSGKNYAIRSIAGTAFIDEGWYLSKPVLTVSNAVKTIDKLKSIGVSGIHYSGIGEMLFNDYEPSGIVTRQYTKEVYDGLLAYTRQALGSAGVYRGNAYSVGDTDYIDALPDDSSHDFMVDETVPFYPIVLHGYVPYSFTEGNLRDDMETEFLRGIEYGAVPSFFVTHDDSRKLLETESNFLYSSQFGKWESRIVDEYGKFDALAGVFAQEIVDHEKLSANRYATTYEDGTKVIVDYGTKSFEVTKGGGA
ncbi:hypothetical protein GZH47_00910 [Paenibacillus rhizovicinus]|uniref:Uncharacterized protein n=1 Tax=Paenibacillus rhizovicinus TaxID=2704463 RepID=A0A6C0NYI3_9BACL|nr:DUF5696 domain-containing protein [Paenibacillus rhizovicinus]QHW29532.1 hypothetical protein GZH47_00910 [Paenibacillus rhizovicinus]